MTVVLNYVDAACAIVKRDAIVFLSYRLRFFAQVATMLMTLTVFYYVAKIVKPDAVGADGRYYAFVVVGIVSMAILTSALQIAELVRMELLQGNFERMLISPLGPVGGAMAIAIFPILHSMLIAGVMLLLAAGVFGVPVLLGGIVPALGVAALGAIAFAAIGLFFVAGLLAYKSAMGATWVLAGLSLIGGVYFPVTLFPSWIEWLSNVQPFTPAVDLLRHLLVGTPSLDPAAVQLAKIVGFTIALLPLSTFVLWQAVKLARRRGTIMEY
jgi:ABC-2 type transport system permease protein